MSKRFTDTEKYKKKFIRELPGAYKLFWDYLYHDCSFAGIWYVDFEVAQIRIGKDMPKDKEEAIKLFNKHEQPIIILNGGSKWFIKAFILFQYGELNSNNKLHLGVSRELEKEGVFIPLKYPFEGAKDKGKGKDKDKEYFELIKKEGMQGEGDEREEVLGNLQEKKSDDEKFNLFWEAYPKRKSKGQAEKAWLKIKPSEQLLATMFAKIEQAKTSEDWIKEGGKYIPYPATWLNAKGWEDEYKPAITQGTSKTAGNWALLEQRKREREKAEIQT